MFSTAMITWSPLVLSQDASCCVRQPKLGQSVATRLSGSKASGDIIAAKSNVMTRVSLATYSVRLRDKNTHEKQRVDCFGPNEDDLLKVLHLCLESMRKSELPAHDQEARQVFNVVRIEQEGRTISGIIESGVYGRGCKLRHVENWSVTHRKTAKEADMLPFYFLFDIPQMTDEGFLILERIGNVGIRKALGRSIEAYIDVAHKSCAFKLWHLARGDVINDYLDGVAVSAIRFVRFGLTRDLADALPRGHSEQRGGSMELVVRLGRGKTFSVADRLKRLVGGRLPLNRFFEIEAFPYDNVKLNVVKDGGSRTIDLSKLSLRGFYNMSEAVDRDQDGNPKFESIDSEARFLLTRIKERVYGPPEGT